MPLTISLEDEAGGKLEAFSDAADLLVSLIHRQPAGSFKLVEAIDPYGDTTFNKLQMDNVISDLTALLPLCTADDEKRLVADVLRLARRCEASVHIYLKFYGD